MYHMMVQVLMDLDQLDEQNGRTESIHEQLHSAYDQFEWLAYGGSKMKSPYLSDDDDTRHIQELKPGPSFSPVSF